MSMKRYMLNSFFIDTVRNVFKVPGVTPERYEKERKWLCEDTIIPSYGAEGLDAKFERYLSLEPPPFTVVTDVHDMLTQVHSAYIGGYYYPALTGACCVGERIFNLILLRVRDYYKSTEHYKDVHSKESFDDWHRAVSVLADWGALTPDLAAKYERLREIRRHSIHFSRLADLSAMTSEAISTITTIAKKLFGAPEDTYFLMGHMFVKGARENEPLIQEFHIPACVRVGYRYQIKTDETGNVVLLDATAYEDRDVTDDEWMALRGEWLNGMREEEKKG